MQISMCTGNSFHLFLCNLEIGLFFQRVSSVHSNLLNCWFQLIVRFLSSPSYTQSHLFLFTADESLNHPWSHCFQNAGWLGCQTRQVAFPSCPTDLVTNFQLQNSWLNVPELFKICRSPNLKSIKLWKGRSRDRYKPPKTGIDTSAKQIMYIECFGFNVLHLSNTTLELVMVTLVDLLLLWLTRRPEQKPSGKCFWLDDAQSKKAFPHLACTVAYQDLIFGCSKTDLFMLAFQIRHNCTCI